MAARANVNFYAIDPRGLAGMTNDFMEAAGIGGGVGATGPVLFVPGTNAPSDGVTGARRDRSTCRTSCCRSSGRRRIPCAS